MLSIVLISVIYIALIALALKIRRLFKVPPVPKLNEEWWGPGQPTDTDTEIRPFTIDIDQNVLDDLSRRLHDARAFVRPLEGVRQEYGMNTELLAKIVSFWKDKYDWRQREVVLNGIPQFQTKIQGLDIHFLHVKPSPTDAPVLPLLLLHGWPGSVREFYEIIPILTGRRDGVGFVFEVIAPSLPGFGFSSAATKKGLGPAKMALILKNLMHRLGHRQFYVQGGDWGAIIASHMATLFPNEVSGLHVNMAFTRSHPLVKVKTFLKSTFPAVFASENDRRMMAQTRIYPTRESGYYQLQATKPDTLGVALNDSPVGLAAYILEKFTTWTNPDWINRQDGGLLEKYDYAKLLDNVMIYWVTNSITTSCRIYYEHNTQESQNLELDRIPVNVPTAIAKFKHEIILQPDEILKYKYPNLLHSSEFQDGGHFAAFEMPEVLADDVFEATSKFVKYAALKKEMLNRQ